MGFFLCFAEPAGSTSYVCKKRANFSECRKMPIFGIFSSGGGPRILKNVKF